MRKLILTLFAGVTMINTAHADEWRYRRFEGPRPGYGYHREYRGGDNGGAIVGGLIGGMIIGGMLNQMSQPRYYQQPVCQRVFVGNVVVDGQMVEAYKTICQ